LLTWLLQRPRAAYNHLVGERYGAWVRRHHWAILAVAGILTIGCGAVASRLALRVGIEELLPTSDLRVRALTDLEHRMGQLSSLVVQIHSPDRERNLAYAAVLRARLDQEPAMIERAIFGSPELHDFFSRHRWLYADEPTLAAVLERLRYERDKAKSPFYVALDEPESLESIDRRTREKNSGFDKLPGGIFQNPDGSMVALVVLPSRTLTSTNDLALETLVQKAIAQVPPPAGIVIRFGGEVHGAVRERRAVEEDMAITSIAVAVLVALVVCLYFGKLRALPLAALPALCGLCVAMAVGKICFGALNATTAFLAAIIVGNGINYPILTMARYEEERARGATVARALDVAIAGTARATSLAAFAASASYGSLALTRFRGFSQFGIIGAIGMALSWAATMSVLPAAIWAADRRRDAVASKKVRRADYGIPFARAVAARPWLLLGVGMLCTAIAAIALPSWLADPFEYDFSNLRATHAGDRRDDQALDDLFGRALSPSVMLADTPEQAQQAAVILRARAKPAGSPISMVVTINDLLPGAPDVQQRKIALLDQIRGVLDDPAVKTFAEDHAAEIDKWRPPAGVRPLGLGDLPPLALRPFVERDGTLGRVVLIYPPLHSFSVTNGHDLTRLAQAIGEISIDGKTLRAAGRAMVFTAMVEAIAHDAPIATLASFAAVALLTLTLLGGRPGALWVLAALAIGVLWMLGVAALLDMKVNFLNFIALPITFGIGVDYGVNVYLRYRAEGPGRMVNAVGSTGGAVALNSATTIIGYGSLLLAHNRALRSFGVLAILGELACITVALLLLPAAIELRDRRATAKAAVPAM
jgi:predicted RND superfamily exporter protein